MGGRVDKFFKKFGKGKLAEEAAPKTAPAA
jgi:hypothetical protein